MLTPMGKNFFNCNKVSAGQIAKVCNNAALGIQMVSLAEACALAERLGIDMKIQNDVMMVTKRI